jgi:hypothetical protein
MINKYTMCYKNIAIGILSIISITLLILYLSNFAVTKHKLAKKATNDLKHIMMKDGGMTDEQASCTSKQIMQYAHHDPALIGAVVALSCASTIKSAMNPDGTLKPNVLDHITMKYAGNFIQDMPKIISACGLKTAPTL